MALMISPLFAKSHGLRISTTWDSENDVTLFTGDCRDFLRQLPDHSAQLIVTSPPYNIGKSYERRFPLDILLYEFFTRRGLHLRNRIIWHFEHGLHCSQRFSGRYETILWFTKSDGNGNYFFNLDPVRVPQKYPGKLYFKGPNKGKPSANPLGKNPGDVWVIPNVKHNHPEKTDHPCQFPVELVERLVLSLTKEGDLVGDPYMGVGSTLVAAVLNKRRAAGSDISAEYVKTASHRIEEAAAGVLRTRPRHRPVYEPPRNSRLTRKPWENSGV